MVRVPEGTPARYAPGFQSPGGAVNPRHLQRLRWLERRQHARQAGRQHRLASARRPRKEQVVAAGRRDLQRPLGSLLPLDVVKVERIRLRGDLAGLGRRQHLPAAEVVEQCEQRLRRQDLEIARPGGFRTVAGGADQAAARLHRRHGGRQNARDLGERAVEAEFAERDMARDVLDLHGSHRRQQSERDGQVEMAAFFLEVGRGEIDGDALRRQPEADGGERRPHPLAAFRHRLVRQADDVERGEPAAEMHLDIDLAHLDAVEGDRRDMRDRRTAAHRAGPAPPCPARRPSIASQMSAAIRTPSKRSISWMPVGEVTLISVR